MKWLSGETPSPMVSPRLHAGGSSSLISVSSYEVFSSLGNWSQAGSSPIVSRSSGPSLGESQGGSLP